MSADRSARPGFRGQLVALLLALSGVTGLVAPAAASGTCTAAARCADLIRLEGGGLLPYYRSLPLVPSGAVRRVVLVVHGNRRNADEYFEYAIEAARTEGVLDSTLIIGPHFQTADDQPGPGEHYWSSGGWKTGDRSRDRARVSSFAVMNQLLGAVCPAGRGPFPSLRSVVLVGHSAGAQFVNRYAAGGAGCPDPAVEVRYVVMNPSSYLYVDGRRPMDDAGRFLEPRTSCAGYDDYKYGLGDLNRYMRSVGRTELRRRLFTRRTTYLAGSEDTQLDSSLDGSCAARLQGENRLARFRSYGAYARLFAEWRGSTFIVVPGVGHSGRRMLVSEAARAATFR
jgi:hypothetical protein